MCNRYYCKIDIIKQYQYDGLREYDVGFISFSEACKIAQQLNDRADTTYQKLVEDES